jgi:hypothetical protein
MVWRFASDRLVVECFVVPERRCIWRLADRWTVGVLCRRHSVPGELRRLVVDSVEGKKVK